MFLVPVILILLNVAVSE